MAGSEDERRKLPEAENLSIANLLKTTAPGLRVLTRYPADAYDWKSCTPNEDKGEGQNQPDFRRDIFLPRTSAGWDDS